MELIYVALPLQLAILLGVVLAFSSTPKRSWLSTGTGLAGDAISSLFACCLRLYQALPSGSEEILLAQSPNRSPAFVDFELKTERMSLPKTSLCLQVETSDHTWTARARAYTLFVGARSAASLTCLSTKIAFWSRKAMDYLFERWQKWEGLSQVPFDLMDLDSPYGPYTPSSEVVFTPSQPHQQTIRRRRSASQASLSKPMDPYWATRRKISQKIARIDMIIFRQSRARPLKSIDEVPGLEAADDFQ